MSHFDYLSNNSINNQAAAQQDRKWVMDDSVETQHYCEDLLLW